MVKQITAYKSETGVPRTFDTYEEAAADEVAAAIRVIVPKSLVSDEDLRQRLSEDMAHALLVEQDETILKAWAQILATLEAEPKTSDNTITFDPKVRDTRPLQQRRMSSILQRIHLTGPAKSEAEA